MNDQHNKPNPNSESSVLGAIKSYFLSSVIFPLKLIGSILDWKEFKKDSSYVFSRILADEYLRLPIVISFWLFFGLSFLVMLFGSWAMANIVIDMIPWKSLNAPERIVEAIRDLMVVVAVGTVSLLDVMVADKALELVKKKFQKISAGGRYEK